MVPVSTGFYKKKCAINPIAISMVSSGVCVFLDPNPSPQPRLQFVFTGPDPNFYLPALAN